MLELAFSFQGRLKRLPFFLGEMALGATFAVGLLAIAVGGILAAKSHDWASVAALVLCILPLVVALLWCSLSLHVRRIRDIGWDPSIVIACWIIANIMDKLILVRLLPALAEGHGTHGTYIGGAFNIGLSLLLLFLPSHQQLDDDDFVTGLPSPTMPASTATSAPLRPAQVGARREFGRRGLA